jgi:DNA polymerase III alpha subunit
MGCFYVESPAMRQLIWKLRCDNYLTLVAASSIIRPGVASSGMMKAYIDRHHDPSQVQYIHPKMEHLLQETYGVMVYQEDVIKVAHHFAGLDLAQADVLRRAMSGKYRSRAAFQKIVDTFFSNCASYGYEPSVAQEVWRQIESFSGYSFSKAHSASFAVESYQSLYLKTYYPLEFMVAVINNFGGFYRTEFYVHEARRCGAHIEAPDLNQSGYLTSIQGKTIYLGWVHVQGLEHKLAHQLVAEAQAQPFYSFQDFCRRMPVGIEQLTILIRVGAFRSFGISKKELLWQAHAQVHKRLSYQASPALFQLEEPQWQFPVLKDRGLEDAYDQLELLGFMLESPFRMLLDTPVFGHVAATMGQALGQVTRMLGYLVTVKPTRTKKGERMVFGYFVDHEGQFFDTVQFPKSCSEYPFKGRGIYLMEGRVQEEYGHPALHVTFMEKQAMAADPRV